MTKPKLIRLFAAIVCAGLLAACEPADAPRGIDGIANDYVQIVLAAGKHDPNFVDAYYGPESLKNMAATDERDVTALREAATQLQTELRGMTVPQEHFADLRHHYLDKQLTAIITRLAMLDGKTLPFDEETRLLYDAVAPHYEAEHFEEILAKIETLLPGDALLAERVENFRQAFIIPPDKLESVFNAAIEACRARTLEHLSLPEQENFTVEYVNEKPWSGYNWYQGNAYSLIQVNTDLPIFIDRAVDLGCHEGYPGHHTYNALLETELVRNRGWVEFSVYPLFSPQSLIAEGSANYGIQMAFPGERRFEFERDVLMPLAGIDTGNARRYWELRQLLKDLEYAGNEAARRYLNGEIDREEAADWLVRYTLMSPERASQRVDFFDTYRGYVINYNHGQALVRDYVERNSDDAAGRWRVFGELLGSPRLPSDLR